MNAQVIIEKLVANNGRYRDLHTGDISNCSGYVILTREKTEVCPLYKGDCFSLNPFYLSTDGELSLSTWAIGQYYKGDMFPGLVEKVVWFDQAA